MTVTIYRSTDASAPTLTGQVNSLVNVLDQVLVTGYGSQPAAGWTKPFTGTNSADFKQGTGSNGFYIEVNDNAPGAAGAQEARIRGYETMTAFNTGLNLFPTTTQTANGYFVRKSLTADATARAWIIAADARTFYMFVLTGDTAGTYYGWSFGEFYSPKTNDAGRVLLLGRSTENASLASQDSFANHVLLVGNSGITGKALARGANQAPSSIIAPNVSLYGDGNTGQPQNQYVEFTNGPDGKIYMTPIRIIENSSNTTGSIRGHLRGLWFWCHNSTAASDQDTITGTGDLSGRSFLVIKSVVNANVILVETSNTWDTN